MPASYALQGSRSIFRSLATVKKHRDKREWRGEDFGVSKVQQVRANNIEILPLAYTALAHPVESAC